MKITDLSILCKWETVKIKYLFILLYLHLDQFVFGQECIILIFSKFCSFFHKCVVLIHFALFSHHIAKYFVFLSTV